MDVDGGLFYLSISHLRGDGTLPDQLVKALLLAGSIDAGFAHVGRADGLVSLLRSLRAGMIGARLAVLIAVNLDNLVLAGIAAEGREVYAVGTHVGDASAFVQALSHHHGLAYGEAELAGCFLLQG